MNTAQLENNPVAPKAKSKMKFYLICACCGVLIGITKDLIIMVL